jgi:hypothetical protein
MPDLYRQVNLDQHISFLYARMSKLALSNLSFRVDSADQIEEMYDQRGDENVEEYTPEKRNSNPSEGKETLLNAEELSLSLQRAKTKKKSILALSSFKKPLKDRNIDLKEPLMCAHHEEKRIQLSWETNIECISE